MFIHNTNVNYSIINDLGLPNVSLSSNRIFLSQEDSFAVDSSMFVVEGSYEEGYVNNDTFRDVAICLGLDIFPPDFTEDEIVELEKDEVYDMPYEAIYTW